jgi:hypothetical protein
MTLTDFDVEELYRFGAYERAEAAKWEGRQSWSGLEKGGGLKSSFLSLDDERKNRRQADKKKQRRQAAKNEKRDKEASEWRERRKEVLNEGKNSEEEVNDLKAEQVKDVKGGGEVKEVKESGCWSGKRMEVQDAW